jgi:GntR family transcriptional regulator, transcriptional repressor for pyruvate dehydrogenase complex
VGLCVKTPLVAAESEKVERAPRPVRRSRLYEEVVERLRELIDVQELEPGDRLMSERELAERLGLSRTPVRQALGTSATAVASSSPARRTTCSPPSSELLDRYAQLSAVMEVREAIETQTSRLAARRREAADLRAMRKALDRMQVAIDSEGEPADADATFHTAIVRAAPKPLLERLWEELAESIDQTRRASLARPDRPPRSLAAHRAILDAIEAKDEGRAAASMREHLAVVGDLGFLTGLR